MIQSQSNDEQRLHVAMITEGTYPFHFGGVSTWCHILIGDLSHVDFTLISLIGNTDADLQFVLPPNIVDFRPIPVWGIYEAAENRSRLSLPELLDARLRTGEQSIVEAFVPPFRSFLRELYADKTDLQRLAESIHGMYRFFVTHDFDRTLRSRAVWQCFLAETQAFFPRAAAQAGYPGATYSLADVGRAMQWLYHWLFPLAQPLPKVDVVHIAMAGLCTLIATAMKLEYGTPFMLTEHGIYLREAYLAQADSSSGLFHKLFNLRFALRMTELTYQLADLISPCCDYNQRWELRNGARPEQIRTIYYGVDSSVFTPASRQEGDQPVVCWVGRIDPLKDLLTLIRAADIVRRFRPQVRFRLFGSASVENEGYYAKCLALRAELGLEETVVFAGFRSNTAAAFNEGDIAVLSSVSEALPFSLLEAMLCEKPVVATAVGGVPEQVAGCGFAVEPRNPQEIAQAILTLIEDPELSRNLGRAGREKALQAYSVRQSGSAHEDAYLELVRRREMLPHLPRWNEKIVTGWAAGDNRIADPVMHPLGANNLVAVAGFSDSSWGPRQLSSAVIRPWITVSNGGSNGHNSHNGHDGTAHPAQTGGAAARNGNGNGHAARSNGHGPALPQVPSWRFNNPAGLAALVEEVAERDLLPVDGLEITALLESMGVTDDVALQRYGAPDAFALGDEVLARLRARHQARGSGSGARPPAGRPPWARALGDYARGPLALLTALSIMLIISAHSLVAGWDAYRLLVLSAGLTSAMLVASGLAQAPTRRTSIYLGAGNSRAAERFFWRAMMIGAVCVGVVAAVLALTGIWLQGYWPWLTSQYRITFLSAFVGLSAIWLASGGLSLLRMTERLTLGLLAGLSAGLLSDRIAAQFTPAHLTVGAATGFAVAMLIVVQALRSGFRNWTPAGQQIRPQGAGQPHQPPASYLFYEAAPYFLYSALYMVFLIVAHAIAWFGILEPGQSRLWAITSVEVGLTLGLLPIILVSGIPERTLREFWRVAPALQDNTPGEEVSPFRYALDRFHRRYWRLNMLVLTALSLVAYGLVSAAMGSGLVERWLALEDATHIARFFAASLCINWLISWGLFDCMFCITLGRPWPAVRAVLLAIVVTVIVGVPLSLLLDYSFAAAAFIGGALIFVFVSQRAKAHLIRSADYHVVSLLQ